MSNPRVSNRLRRQLLPACLAVLALTAACTTPQPAIRLAPVSEQRGPAGVVVKDLAKFYGQSLRWGPCLPYATSQQAEMTFGSGLLQCARAKVPLDYAKPDGDTITLGLLRRKATQPHPTGSLLINPGGPGESGMELAAALASGAYQNSALSDHFDLVGFDPRGIAASQPAVRCLTDKQQDAQRADSDDHDTSPAGIRRFEQQQRDYAKACGRNTGKDLLANLDSRTVARDMDVLRSALGDKKLTYVGFSYGTRLGNNYAEQFPRNVRAMVLDGAVDPNQNTLDSVIEQHRGFQDAFNAFASWCAKQSSCPLGAAPDKATENFRNLMRPLLHQPIRLRDGRSFSYDDATTGTLQALYSQQLWQQLATGLAQLKDQRDGTLLMQLADLYLGRQPDGHYSNVQDASTAVHCVDDPRSTDRAALLDAARQEEKAAPFLADGQGPAAALDACAFWPVPVAGVPAMPKVSGLPKILVVSTTDDPATPYRAGIGLAKALHGVLLTFRGTQHTVFLQGNKCVDDVGVRYLLYGTPPKEGTRC